MKKILFISIITLFYSCGNYNEYYSVVNTSINKLYVDQYYDETEFNLINKSHGNLPIELLNKYAELYTSNDIQKNSIFNIFNMQKKYLDKFTANDAIEIIENDNNKNQVIKWKKIKIKNKKINIINEINFKNKDEEYKFVENSILNSINTFKISEPFFNINKDKAIIGVRFIGINYQDYYFLIKDNNKWLVIGSYKAHE